MSKAFTKEDDSPEVPLRPRLTSPLPPGAKNYMTASGAAEMKHELEQLQSVERPRLTADESQLAQHQLGIVQQRIDQLRAVLRTAEIVPVPANADDTVRFGATVTVRNRRGEESSYRIVGVDETDLDRDWVSWISPIAKALLNARIGQRVRFKFPSGEDELEILSVTYT